MAQVRFPMEGSIPEFLAALASPEDAHGSLAAAAIAGAMGASLLRMVAALPRTLPSGDDDPTALVSAAAALVRVQEELLESCRFSPTRGMSLRSASRLRVSATMPRVRLTWRDPS